MFDAVVGEYISNNGHDECRAASCLGGIGLEGTAATAATAWW
jgi:hypothetical protein